MNRVIKFRGQRIDNNEWVYGYFVKTPNGQCRIYYQPFDDATSNTYHIVNPETVGQFISLTDKNGKDIYEGDILHYQFEEVNYEAVQWDNTGFWTTSVNGLTASDLIDGAEIIGNIHQHPELLTPSLTKK